MTACLFNPKYFSQNSSQHLRGPHNYNFHFDHSFPKESKLSWAITLSSLRRRSLCNGINIRAFCLPIYKLYS